MIPGGSIANMPVGDLVASSDYSAVKESLLEVIKNWQAGQVVDDGTRLVCFWLVAEFGEPAVARAMADEMVSAGNVEDALAWLRLGAESGDPDCKACLGAALVADAKSSDERIDGGAWWCAAVSEGSTSANAVRLIIEELLSTSELLESARLSRGLVNSVN